jgi:uncharacterized protein YjbI with pentapeptide repeats
MWKNLVDAPRILVLIIVGAATFFAARKFPDWQVEICLAGGFIIFALLVWMILTLYLNADSYEQKKDFVDVFAKIIGGAAVVVSLIFTWQELKLTKTTSETTQSLSLLTLQNTERRQIEDRLNKALEQLGSETREARIGAIYSLGKIASDSIEFNQATKNSGPMFEPPTDFHWTVMQTLASYVRGNAARTGGKAGGSKQIQPDIQAALNVLGWRKRAFKKGEDQRLELYQTDLHGLILKEKDGLQGSKQGADLAGTQLWKVDLTGANLRGINLADAVLDDSILKNASLFGACLANTGLIDTDLEGADLQGVMGLTQEQVETAKNWQKAKNLPDMQKPSKCKN